MLFPYWFFFGLLIWGPLVRFFGFCVVPAFLVLLGVLFFVNFFSCCISLLSCSIYLSFVVNVLLVFELLRDSNLLCLCYSFLRCCASKFPKIVCGPCVTWVLLVLCKMMWLLYFIFFASDTAFAFDFLNAVNCLVCCSVSYMVVCGLYFRLKNVWVHGNVGGALLLF